MHGKIILVKYLLITSLVTLAGIVPQPVIAQQSPWYYPIAHYLDRQSYKGFGQLIDANFYIGKEQLFPTKYTGYHAGRDLEIFDNEKNADVPIYAVANGKISFAGPISGYGGLILESLDGENHTALYGHISLANLKVHTGDHVSAGQQLTILGKGFSSETAGERKHLHFAIYKGTDLYYKGYEQSQAAIAARFEDPTQYLQSKNAKDVSTNQVTPTAQNLSPTQSPVSQTTLPATTKVQNQSFLQWLINFLHDIFSRHS